MTHNEGSDRSILEAKRRRARRVNELLRIAYGSPRHGNKDDPVDELVFIILSQMTTHWSFNRVFDRLKMRYPAWEALPATPLNELASVIADAGLSNQKAPRIKAIIERIHTDFGSVSLESLNHISDEALERYLTSLPGVGVKTAKCVMMYSFGREVLPVDTHVWRVSRRLGMVPPDMPYSKVHEAIESIVRPRDRYDFHVNAIAHGRAVCLPKTPRCPACPLRRLCVFYNSRHCNDLG